MAVPNVPSCWKATLSWNVGTPAQVNEVVWHVLSPFSSAATGVAQEVANAWMVAGGLGANMGNVAIGNTVTVQPYDGSAAPTVVQPTGFFNTAMGSASNPVPANVAFIITKRTALAGRAFRGRMYIPAVAQTGVQIGGTQWNSSFVTTMQAAANASWAKLTAGPLISSLLVYSHKLNVATPVTSLIGRQYLGTQRRRTTLHSP